MSKTFTILGFNGKWAVDWSESIQAIPGYNLKRTLMELAFKECNIWEMGFVLGTSTYWVGQEAYQQAGDYDLGKLLFRGTAEDYCGRVMFRRLDDAEAMIDALEKRIVFNLLKQNYAQ
jgi:hypothetical protein